MRTTSYSTGDNSCVTAGTLATSNSMYCTKYCTKSILLKVLIVMIMYIVT